MSTLILLDGGRQRFARPRRASVEAQLALSDRDDIFTQIEAESPRAAVHVDQQIVHAARRLIDFPESGRPGGIAGTRELVSLLVP